MLHLIGVPGKKAELGPAEWYRLEEDRLIEGPGGVVWSDEMTARAL